MSYILGNKNMNIKIINAAVPAGNLINNINNNIKKTNDNINIIIIPVIIISSDNGLSYYSCY